MEANNKIKEFIKSKEGLRLVAYLCPAGVPTIGYGHTGNDVTKKDVINKHKITQSQADLLFDNDLKKIAEAPLNSFFKNTKLSDNQFSALCSFTYNCGIRPTSTLFKKIVINPNDKSIWKEFTKWSKAAGKTLSGLLARRKQEALFYFTGDINSSIEKLAEVWKMSVEATKNYIKD